MDRYLPLLEKRKKKHGSKKKPLKAGPEVSRSGVPYDYIVIIDAGSKGSRVHVYSWLNPGIALDKKVDFTQAKQLMRRKDESDEGEESDTDEDSDEDDEDDESKKKLLYPKIKTKSRWHKKITPGISTFNKAPHKIGKHHLSKLLSRASKIVPKSQHYRTPIFLHATAGMRLLSPTEQQQILNEICLFFENKSDFFIPDCASHVNVIDGDYEGLYGWLSINTLIGAFDDPSSHKHGKNHTTYGLLDMGGASTQVVFQPNTTEIDEHQNNLYHMDLRQVPTVDEKTEEYKVPLEIEYNVYSDSFLGFGMYQARSKYMKSLIASDEKEDEYHYWGLSKSPINDPCIPKGFTTSDYVNDRSYDFIGESDFEKCLTRIFPVLQNSTHGGGGPKTNCKQFSEGDEVSTCLLNELIPSFDFDVNHFIGVSGYWDAIEDLLFQQQDDDEKSKRDKLRDQKNTYDYKKIFNKTQKMCSQSWSSILELNSQKEYKDQLSEEELSTLCFKSSWILNFLHLGLGFPRFGIDNVTNSNKGFETLQLVEQLGGSSFSWALGRAVLYANDEYIQAYNNYTNRIASDEKKGPLQLKRPGFYHSSSPNIFQFGAEQNGIVARPNYMKMSANNLHYFDYETKEETDHESPWNIEPHRWYGFIIFAVLLSFVIWLMLGGRNRALFVTKVTSGFRKLVKMTPGYNGAKYTSVPSGNYEGGSDMELGLELNELGKDIEDQFEIGDDDEAEDDEEVGEGNRS
ncbi:Golgi apyrase [Candida parapsilosis]|nr:Golgi apyrase [Candida parapsilosis]